MVITNFIDYLNKTKGWNLQSDYYAYINKWKEWWEGYVPSFHEYKEVGLDGNRHKRRLFRMGMAKKVCEDWASLVLNDKTTFTISDKATKEWLCGNDDQTGGMLQKLNFWNNANKLGELTFRSGTGAFVLSCENVMIQDGQMIPSKQASLFLDYNPAECILPITIKHNEIVECAFLSEVVVQGKQCIYLQIHTLENSKTDDGVAENTYVITNEYYEAVNSNEAIETYHPAPLPAGMARSVHTGSPYPWFGIIRPNIVKNILGGTGMGMAVYSEALDQLMHCDTAFNNYHRDIHLGGKKVFYNKKLIQERVNEKGEVIKIAPDDVQQQLFYVDANEDPDTPAAVYDYNPLLRAEENSKAVQDALDYLSFKVGLGTHHYQFTNGGVRTATEYTGSRQDMVQNANKHQTEMEHGLISIIRALIYAGKNVCGEAVNPDCDIMVNWDDSYITDNETQRQNDKQDALDGFIPKYKYNMRWHGMSEEDARKSVEEAEEENKQPELTFDDEE